MSRANLRTLCLRLINLFRNLFQVFNIDAVIHICKMLDAANREYKLEEIEYQNTYRIHLPVLYPNMNCVIDISIQKQAIILKSQYAVKVLEGYQTQFEEHLKHCNLKRLQKVYTLNPETLTLRTVSFIPFRKSVFVNSENLKRSLAKPIYKSQSSLTKVYEGFLQKENQRIERLEKERIDLRRKAIKKFKYQFKL